MNQLARLGTVDPPAPTRRRRGAKQGSFGVLDIGSTQIVCIIARSEREGEPRSSSTSPAVSRPRATRTSSGRAAVGR